MELFKLSITKLDSKLTINLFGELTVHTISSNVDIISTIQLDTIKHVELNLAELGFADTAGALFINNFLKKLELHNIEYTIINDTISFKNTIELVRKYKQTKNSEHGDRGERYALFIDSLVASFLSTLSFIGLVFLSFSRYFVSIKLVRLKEIAFEINESGIKALSIIMITSFLIGLVVAYQSAYQLKLYGANIYIVDMLGLSILRELSPLITAIVIAGRSGSAFTAQIGAMKITEELDAMKTMGFDPTFFLVLPKIIALMIIMPILIFISDVMGVIGGMIIANIDLNISMTLFLERFSDVIAVKHFIVGIVKGPFFAFLIAAIGIYRGMVVKNDTQSIGINTTKSVVESIFMVIVCDAIFSIAFTNLGI